MALPNRHGVTGGNAVADVDIALSYNSADQVASISRYLDDELTVTADYTYDSSGLLVGLIYHQGDTVLTQYTFSGVAWNIGESVSPLLPGEGQGVRAGQSMLPTHDTSDIVEALSNGTSSSNLLTTVTSSDGTVTYTYDAIGQLLSATYSNESITDETYTYDANGNRTSATGSASVVGADNQLQSDGLYRYAYDAEGNRIAKFIDTDADGLLDEGDTSITQYIWDARNRLMEVTNYATYGGSASQVVDYFYDAENRWIAETIDADGDGQIDRTLGFVYDGDQIALQFEKNLPSPASGRGAGGEGGEGSSEGTALTTSDLSHRYLWQANAVDQLLADEALSPLPLGEGQGEGGEGGGDGYDLTTAGDVLWSLTDHLGTVRDLATYDASTGITSIANHRVYDSFGNLTSETNAAVDCLFGFTGRAESTATGLRNHLNRWTDPETGNWLSKDPMGFDAGDTNTYRYCGNSPTNYTDPTGLQERGPQGFRRPSGLPSDLKWVNPDEEKFKAQLEKCAAKWRTDHWDLAATLLEYFLNHKNGSTKDEKDVSHLASHIKDDPEMQKWLNNFFAWEAIQNTSFWSTSKITIKLNNEKIGHRRWIMGDGEPFYAFGGMDLYVTGTLEIDKEMALSSERTWKFTGTVTIRDTYTFPDVGIRTWFADYDAAHQLEMLGYNKFKVIMKWQTTMSGDNRYR